MNAIQVAALTYAHLGWSVIPVGPDKRPLVSWARFQETIAEKDEIMAWWRQWPDANVAIVTGRVSGLTVVDIDGDVGRQTYREQLRDVLPETWTVKTRKGGHLYFAYDPRPRQGVARLPGIDIRNDGGYVVAPPSKHEGGRYEVTRQIDRAIVEEWPAALTGEAAAIDHAPQVRNSDQAWVADAYRGVGEGQRNATAARLAGYFHRKGMPSDVILALMEPFASRCSPPIPLIELRRTVESIDRYPVAVGASGGKGLGGITL